MLRRPPSSTAASTCGLGYAKLLTLAPPALWPLVPLPHDGTSEEVLSSTQRAFQHRRLPALAKADLLAALRFLAQAENVPTPLLDRYIASEEMMNGPFLRDLFKEQEARARQESRQEGILQGGILMALPQHLGALPQTIRDRFTAETRARVVSSWHKAALGITDAASARKLLARIRAAAPVARRAA